MKTASSQTSHPLLSRADGLAAQWSGHLTLLARIMIGTLFVASAWRDLANLPGFAGYLASLKVPNPQLLQWVAGFELALGVALIIGIATRYAALATTVFVVVATLLGHRYWDYPLAQQNAQYTHFLKNLSIIGGALLLFITGPGRYSFDNWFVKHREGTHSAGESRRS